MQTTRVAADAALLLADGAGARPIVGVGLRGTVEEFLDSSRDGLGSGYVTRLKVGPRLVDATAVPMLYSGQLRARHAYLVLLIGLIAVAAAIATTARRPPVGARPARPGRPARHRPPRAALVIRSRVVRRPAGRRAPGPGHRHRPRGRTARPTPGPAPTGPGVVTPTAGRRTYPDAFAASVAARLYANGLSRRPVALVTLPGADAGDRLGADLPDQGSPAAPCRGDYPVGSPDGRRRAEEPRRHPRASSWPSSCTARSTRPRAPTRGSASCSRSPSRPAALGRRRPTTTSPPSARAWSPRTCSTVPAGGPATAPLVLVVMGSRGRPGDRRRLRLRAGATARAAWSPSARRPRREPRRPRRRRGHPPRHHRRRQPRRAPAAWPPCSALIRSWSKQGGAFGASGSDGSVPLG